MDPRLDIVLLLHISQMAAFKGSLRRRDGAIAHFHPKYWG